MYIPSFTGSVVQWICITFVLITPIFFLTEATGLLSFGYSKFARREQSLSVPSRVGMFVIYFPAVLLAPAIAYFFGATWTTWHLLAVAMVSLHFGKRCLEVLFVHKYSGVMNVGSMVMICGLYSFQSAFFGYVAATLITPALMAIHDFQSPLMWVGVGLWLAGTLGNAYHHWLLANLRKPGETGYVLPKGGMFRWVSCPHYLSELIGWWGYALFFQHVAAHIVALTMTGYLAGRAHSTLKWYRERMPEKLPTGWKRLVPFVY